MLEFNFHPFPVLETQRLILRSLKPDDAGDLFALRSNTDLMRYIDRPLHQSINDSSEMIRKIHEGINNNEAIAWGISLKGELELSGTISFHRIQREDHRAEIGYMLHPKHWRKGLVDEAITKVIDYGFAVMNLHSIEANVNPGNVASSNLLKKHGFVREAYFKENYYFNGKFIDTEIYSLLTNQK